MTVHPSLCDHCRYFDFNGDQDGAYTDEGRCEHPDHPRPSEPFDRCDDFQCKVCSEGA